MKRKMIGYLRRSKANKKRPDDPAYGIEAQRTIIERVAGLNDWEIIWAPADDGATGAHTRRAGLQWTLDQLAAGEADGLVVAKLTRLSRSVADFAQVLRVAKKQGWTVAALDLGIDTGTVNGRLVANIVMSVAEWEREIISERTVEALAEVRESGVRLGRPILMPEDVIARVRRLRIKGHTLRAIAEQLNKDQVPTVHGGARWHSSTLRGVLKRSGGDPRARTPARVA
ncbi:recombinase family protein [Actinoplanes auranticolor]|nr:recombinase family protein [Actinoplanes auranticolor]